MSATTGPDDTTARKAAADVRKEAARAAWDEARRVRQAARAAWDETRRAASAARAAWDEAHHACQAAERAYLDAARDWYNAADDQAA